MRDDDSNSQLEEIKQELAHIRRLLIFALTRAGASQGEIAKALGVNQSSISRMFGPATVKKPRKDRK